MRALIACDGIAGLDSAAAGQVLAQAFADQGAQVALYPMATDGPGLAPALTRLQPDAVITIPSQLDEVAAALRHRTVGTHFVDLSTLPELGVDDVLAMAQPEEWVALRSSTGRLVAVVADDDASALLTGMPGIIAERGRRDDVDLAETLAADGRAAAWLERAGLSAEAGSGAASGLGAVFQAAGGRVFNGVGACSHAGGLSQVMAKADVVVTGAEQLDFHAVGGPVVREVSALAAEALRPVIAVVGRSFVSPRELRLAGIETAYPVLPGAGEEPPTVEELKETAQRVATTWRW